MGRFLLAAVLALWCGLSHGQTIADRFHAKASKAFPESRPINVVFHGHSVPAGYMHAPMVDTLGAYPQLLLASLKQRYPYAQINIYVTAVAEATSADGLSRFNRVMGLRPDVVVLDFALNDRQIGVTRARAALAEMIQKSRTVGADVVLMTSSPDTDESSNRLNQINQMVRELGRSSGVEVCEVYRSFPMLGVSRYMAQPNHPNRSGHRIIAAELLNHFVRQTQPPARPPGPAHPKGKR